MNPAGLQASAAATHRPPVWLVTLTAALALGCLGMAVAETSLWKHYLIDAGESISLAGLGLIFGGGLLLHRQGRLGPSLPLVLPWLLFPVITQGDQIIDHLTINQMRLVVHVLLALLFAAPVLVVAIAARHALAPPAPRTLPRWHWTVAFPGLRPLAEGRVRRGTATLAAALFTLQIWVAHQFLGTLMVVTLILMILAALVYSGLEHDQPAAARRRLGERAALAALVVGVALSLGLFLGFKHRPGAYQGSPAYYMDPSQQDAAYPLDAVQPPTAAPARPDPAAAQEAELALTGYARALEQVLEGYYVADRNYNYAFHNALFVRHTPVLPDYRQVALTTIARAEAVAATARAHAERALDRLPQGDSLGALLMEADAYVGFTFRRARLLEDLTREFERTPAGLQHATHIYEGEGKVLGVRLMEVLAKHQAVLESPATAPIAAEFARISRAIHARYANRIVGF